MIYQVGDILKVREGHEGNCPNFLSGENSDRIEIVEKGFGAYGYKILDKSGKQVGGCNCFQDKDLERTEKTWDNLRVGDELKNCFGHSHWVQGIAGKIMFISAVGEKYESGSYYTKKDLIREKFTIVQDKVEEEIEELTVEEICKRLGKEIKIKK